MRKIAVIFFVMTTTYSALADSFPGPITAHVLRVVDGDTLEVEAPIWPQHWVRTFVRLRGIDAPETRRQFIECAQELIKGLAAKARVEALLGIRDSAITPIVTLSDIELDKFGGRHVATVAMEDGQPLATRLLLEDLALPWDGQGRTPSHC